MSDDLIPLCFLSDLKWRYAEISANFTHYTRTHRDTESVRAMLRYATIQIEKLNETMTYLYNQSIITEECYVKCAYMFTDCNDDLLTTYYDFIKK